MIRPIVATPAGCPLVATENPPQANQRPAAFFYAPPHRLRRNSLLVRQRVGDSGSWRRGEWRRRN